MDNKGQIYEGVLTGEGLRFAVVVSRFNEFISGKLLSGAWDCLTRHGVADKDIEPVMRLAAPGPHKVPHTLFW